MPRMFLCLYPVGNRDWHLHLDGKHFEIDSLELGRNTPLHSCDVSTGEIQVALQLIGKYPKNSTIVRFP